MNLKDLPQKHRDLLISMILLVLNILCIGFFVVTTGQPILKYMLSASIVAIIAVIFAAVLVLRPKNREELRRLILRYQTQTREKGGRLFKYGRIANALTIAILLGLIVAYSYYPALSQSVGVQYLAAGVFIAFIASFIMLITGILRVDWKWGFTVLAIIVIVAVWSIFFR